MTPDEITPMPEKRDPGFGNPNGGTSPKAGDPASTPVASGEPVSAAAPAAPTRLAGSGPLAALRADLDGLRHTIDQLKLRAAPGDTDFVARLEQHHARLSTDLASLENHQTSDLLRSRREAWDSAMKETSVKLRRGAGELGGGLGRAWREMRSAAGKAWGELRSNESQPPQPASPEAPRQDPRDP